MRIAFSFLLLLLFQPVFSQFHCKFDHYSINDGLSNGFITAILQDKAGFMWFGTWDGLNRFDGYSFTTFKSRPGDNSVLLSNRITDLKEDKWGYIWFRTYDSKVFRFNKKTETFENLPGKNNQNGDKNLKINKIIPSKKGDVWLTTNDKGLYRVVIDTLDYTCKLQYFSINSEKDFRLSGNSINVVFEDLNNQVWIAGAKHLECLQYDKSGNLYKVKKWTEEHRKLLNQYNYENCVLENNNLWLGTSQGILINIDIRTGEFKTFDLKNTFSITDLRHSSDNELYIATAGDGFYIFDINSKKIKYHNTDPLVNKITQIYIDRYGLIWISSSVDGVISFNSNTKQLKHFVQIVDRSPALKEKGTCDFIEDKNDILWIGLNNGGFGYYDRENEELQYFYNNPRDPSSKISNYETRIFKDSENIFWMSTYEKGIEKITFLEQKFQHYLLDPNIKNTAENEVRAIYEDKLGRLWVASRAGKLFVYNRDYHLIHTFNSNNSIIKGQIYSILEDNKGVIWIGTKGEGLFRLEMYDNNFGRISIQNYKNNVQNKYSLSDNKIYSILQDSKGRIWLGTYGGGINMIDRQNNSLIFRNINNTFFHYPKTEGRNIRHLMEDKNGNLWIATTDGLIILNINENVRGNNYIFNQYSKIPGDIQSLGNVDVSCLFKDNSDTIWVGTYSGGLHKVISNVGNNKPPRFKVYSKEDGLPSDIILSIRSDKLGNLWIATDCGLSYFNRSKNTFRNYDEYDGILSRAFSENSSCQRKNGHLCFGNSSGFYSFSPEQIKDKKYKANLVITNLRLSDKDVTPLQEGSPLKESISESKEIKLSYLQSAFSIDYVALFFQAQHKIQYAYILEGFEKNWHHVNNQRRATYTNIPPGKYVFRIKCTNNDFIECSEKSINIEILPPPWKTTWAYILYLLVISGIIILVRNIFMTIFNLRNKITIERKISEIKLQFFTNISHELRTPLTLILGPIGQLNNAKQLGPKEKTYLQLIDKNTRRLLRHVNQILDFRKVQNEKMKLKISQFDMVSFTRDLCLNFQELLTEKSITLTFKSDIDHLYVWADPEKMDIVIYNLLSNAIKFSSEGSEVKVDLISYEESNELKIRISDNGIGISKEELPYIFDQYTNIGHNHQNYLNKGTGIGLSLSKELVELHHGKIFVESRPKLGTTFTVLIRTDKYHYHADDVDFILSDTYEDIYKPAIINTGNVNKTGQRSKEDQSEKQSVLIVEDNTELRDFLSDILSVDYNVTVAFDGLDGLNKAKANLPDLIVSDIIMPKMDGINLLKRLKDDFLTSHIPIILLTAKSTIENQIEGVKYGADLYITKPFYADFLLVSISNLLIQRRKLFLKYSDNQKEATAIMKEMPFTAKDKEFLEKVTAIVELNISDYQFNIDKIANDLNLGRTTFYKKLKSITGYSPVEFIRDLRVSRGKELLLKGEHTISEIAYLIGFNSSGYFATCFKEKYNQTPSEFISNKKKA